MKQIITVFLLIVTSLFLGCCGPKIDTSTDVSMKTSIEKVRSSLPENKRKEFDEALTLLAFKSFNLTDIFIKGVTGIEDTKSKYTDTINGKTGLEVIRAAEEVKTKRREEEKTQAIQEIKELEENKSSAEKDKIELAKFKIIRSRFYKTERSFIGENPIIELTVKNDTNHPISRAYFIGTVASPNRSIPLDGRFSPD